MFWGPGKVWNSSLSAINLLSFLLLDLSSFSGCRASLSLNFVVGREAQALCTRRCSEDHFKPWPKLSRQHLFLKVKSHAGIAGSDCADKIAKDQATLKQNNLTNTRIPGAGPGGNPFYNIPELVGSGRVKIKIRMFSPYFQSDILARP
eukprot:1160976-Pelagomonas_calceolata.AAC.4